MHESDIFDRTKIYEKLDYEPQPKDYQSTIPWTIQQQIGATNGIHYADSIGKLNEFPIPEIPIDAPQTTEALCLDIGCGWGRWLVAMGKKGYIPIGIDIRLEFCQIAQQTLQLSSLNGYTVVADLQHLPFKDGIFDVVWSFSVIQHTHKERLKNCLNEIHRILKVAGYCFLEFPNKYGLRNYLGPVRVSDKNKIEDYNSWAVRYYSINEYKSFFKPLFGDVQILLHSMLGIGILSNDVKFISGLKNKVITLTSLFVTQIARLIKPLIQVADSIYLKSIKTVANDTASDRDAIIHFLKIHHIDPTNNLNIIHLLRCPISGNKLKLVGNELLSEQAKLAYPIINNIPIIIPSEGRIIQ